MKKTACALVVTVLCGLPTTAREARYSIPISEAPAGLLGYRPSTASYSLNATDGKKRTGRQKAGLWLLLLGTGGMVVGYLEDSESRCQPGLEHSYLGYDCHRRAVDRTPDSGFPPRRRPAGPALESPPWP